MRIAVIGTGNIGGTLGRALAHAGNEVSFGSRQPDSDGAPGDAFERSVPVAEALEGADVVLLAIPAAAVAEFLEEHAGRLAGVLVVDATNNIRAEVANAAAAIKQAAPEARYARAFNTLGWENFAEPSFDGVAADLFFSCAAADRAIVEGLISDVGLRPAFLGEGAQDMVDSLLPIWFTLAQQRGHRRIALRILEA